MATGSTATLVSATMQLNGEFTQAHILDAVVNSPIGNIAILIYLISAIGFFISVAFFQNYKMGIWLIFGPALWDISANTRNEAVNVNWMYAGKVVQSQEWLTQFSNQSLVDDLALEKGPAVLYTMWDGVVSGAVQNLTGLLATIINDPATRLFAKTNIQEGMLSATIQTPEIREAMRIALGPDCSVAMPVTDASAPKQWSPGEISDLENALANRQIRGIPETVVRKLCVYTRVYDLIKFDPTIENPFDDPIIENDCKNNTWDQVANITNGAQADANCLDFSVSIWQALQVEAEMRLRKLYKSSGANVSGVSALGRDLLPEWSTEMIVQDDTSLRKLVGSYMIRNEMDTLNSLNPARDATDPKVSEVSKNAEVQAIIGWLDKESAQSSAVYFAKSVPYIQGALLYTLAIAYPFICVIMLIPGFHTAMFTWMGVWAWVKSWDIMLYVVSLLSGIMSENILHKGMLHNNIVQNQYPGSDSSITSFADNVVNRLADIEFLHLAIYKAFDDVDPKFVDGLINYIVALSTLSIPAITGMFFLWGRASTLSYLSDGITDKARDATSRMAARLQDRWQRDIEIDKQKDVRNWGIAGVAYGAGVGMMFAGPSGAIAGAALGAVGGDKFGQLNVGYEKGQRAAMYSGHPMTIGAGDLMDPWEAMVTFYGASEIEHKITDKIGVANYKPYLEHAKSPEVRRRIESYGAWKDSRGVFD